MSVMLFFGHSKLHLPQGLCTGCFLCLGCFSLSCMTRSPSHFSRGPLLNLTPSHCPVPSSSLSAFNTVACVFTTPLNFAFWGKLYLNFAGNHGIGSLPELQIPLGEIFHSIFIIMGIPLILGMLCGQYLPKVANILKKPLQYLSVAVFVAMVIIIFTGNLDAFMVCIKYIFLIVLIHNLLALGIGFGTSTLLKLPYKDRRTVTIETGIQNSGLGLILLLNPNIFPDTGAWANNGGMLVITAWWGVWHIISGLTLAYTWRVRGRKEAKEE